ncbi:MAG: type II secretion system protein GspM [Eubacteriales bacterium]|nr:type II secretion system protein GspM [Eubacteriales bacterium]
MKKLNREFTTREKLLILLLCLILVGLAYYQFVDQPVRTALTNAHAERDSLNTELVAVQAKLKDMRRMRDEMEDVTGGGTVSEMKSYNNSKPEIALLNDILRDTPEYSITFANVTRDGDQIRRNFSLRFTADSYKTVQRVIKQLTNSPYRCLVGDLKISVARDGTMEEGPISVNGTATFFETMVGGTVDAGLPATSAAAK